jgi:hypothetical protein
MAKFNCEHLVGRDQLRLGRTGELAHTAIGPALPAEGSGAATATQVRR